MFNVTLWRLHITIVKMESQQCDFYVLLSYSSVSTTEKCYTAVLSWRLYVAGNNKTYLDVRVKCPIFFSDFNQILVIDT